MPSQTNTTPRKRMNRPEEAIHKEVIAFCRAKEAQCPELELLFHIPNGGKRTKAESGVLKAMGQRPGVSDLHLPVAQCQWHGLWIELKAPGESPTDSQLKWLWLMDNQCHMTQVCDSVISALLTIAYYFREDWSHELRQMRLPDSTLEIREHDEDFELIEVVVVMRFVAKTRTKSRTLFRGSYEDCAWCQAQVLNYQEKPSA